MRLIYPIAMILLLTGCPPSDRTMELEHLRTKNTIETTQLRIKVEQLEKEQKLIESLKERCELEQRLTSLTRERRREEQALRRLEHRCCHHTLVEVENSGD